MKTSTYQKLRYGRAKNKGSNVRLARAMRKAADMLEKKGAEELTELEFLRLLSLEKFISSRMKSDVAMRDMAKLIRKIARRSAADRKLLLEKRP